MNELLNILKEYGFTDDRAFEEKEIYISGLSFLELRDELYSLGHILAEDKEKKIYIVDIKVNKFSNSAIVAIKLSKNKLVLCGFCETGLIKSKTVLKVFSKIEEALNIEKIKTPKSYKKLIFICVTGFITFVFGVIVFQGIGIMNATNGYNSSVGIFNETVKKYNALMKKGQFDKVNDMPEKMEYIKKQDSDFFASIGVVFSSNNKYKIEKDTDTVKDLTRENKSLIAIANKLISPKESFVKSRLSLVKEIKKIEAVTSKNDPNGLLNKNGGYTSCIYFSTDLLNNKKIPGNSVISKGTDGGGAIETFSHLSDAKKRCEYLASFDGTVLTTGSYALVGTMVIRISYRLDNDEQLKLTDSIIKSLTKTNK